MVVCYNIKGFGFVSELFDPGNPFAEFFNRVAVVISVVPVRLFPEPILFVAAVKADVAEGSGYVSCGS